MHRTPKWMLLLGALLPLVAWGAEEAPAIEETEHRMVLRIEDGVALAEVERAFVSHTRNPLTMELDLELPFDATVTRLAVQSGGTWTAGELLEEGVASERFTALRTRSRAKPNHTAALLVAGEQGLHRVQLFLHPLQPGVPVRVRYAVTARTRYTEGALEVSFPRKSSFAESWLSESRTKGAPEERTAEVSSPQPELQLEQTEEVVTARLPLSLEGIHTQLGTLALPDGKTAVRTRVQMPGRISAPPVGASVVFVLDASHSVGAEGIGVQVNVARDYLERVPDAQAEVVVFRRHAARLFGGFVPAGEARERLLAALQGGALAPGNGSQLDEAVGLAAEVLRGRRGPLRVVALTDGSLRESFSAAQAAPVWPADTVVHVLLDRRDARHTRHSLSPLTAPTGGILEALPWDRERGRILPWWVEELVRPTHLNALLARADGRPLASPRRAPLLEGEEEELTAVLDRAPAEVVAEGQLWSRPLRLLLEEDRGYSRHLPALLAGSDDKDMDLTGVARAAGVLGPGLSFLAVPAGMRPWAPRGTWGDVEGGLIGGTIGGVGCSVYAPEPAGPAPRTGQWLEEVLFAAARRCGALAQRLRVETTGQEVVDVVPLGRPGRERDCLEEAAWALQLDARFTAPYAREEIAFPPRIHVPPPEMRAATSAAGGVPASRSTRQSLALRGCGESEPVAPSGRGG